MATAARPTSPPQAHIQVEGLTGGFTDETGQLREVLHDVSFGIARSAMTAIVGETGSGKTLTALSMIGLQPSAFRRTAGSIVFEGLDLAAADRAAITATRGHKITMVFQDAKMALNPVFTIGDQISDVVRLHHRVAKKAARQQATALLEQVRVPEAKRRMRQYPHEFSGGMAQRAQLAMALACEPSVLILDEPTTGLDVTIQADILELIVELGRTQGMTTCLITHDLGVVAKTCDFVVVMRDGHVRETGPCATVLGDPEDSYTRQLIAASTLEGLGRP